MKKSFLRPILAALFALSVATAGFAFVQTVAAASPLAACPSCSYDLGCPGSSCTCKWNQSTNKYVCQPPSQ